MNARPSKNTLTNRRKPFRLRRSGGIIGMAVVSLTLTAGVAQADSLIAYWNFNDEPTGAIPAPLQANVGSGQIDLSGWDGQVNIGSGFSGGGTQENALFDDPAGNSLRVNAGISPFPGNFTHIDFKFSMAGRDNLSMNFAMRPQWSSASGNHTFSFHAWSWSTDGVNFSDALGYEITEFGGVSFWETRNLDFSAATELNGAEEVTLRLILAGANSNQNTSFDNIQIHASLIPVPGVASVFGVAGLLLRRTRRRRS